MAIMNGLMQNELFRSAAILIASILTANIIHFILRTYAKRFAKNTKTDIDDLILNNVTKPIYLLIIVVGIYFSLKQFQGIENYNAWIDSIFFVIIALFSALLVSRILTVIISKWLKVHKKFEKTPRLINKMVTVIIFLIAILMVLSHFEIEISPLIATLGIGGLAIGLALQNTLSNFFAGLHIISDKPVDVGDFIELLDGNLSGHVEDIGWRSTKIKTLQNNMVIIPNAKLAESIIINDSLYDEELVVLVPCGVSYESNLAKVERVTLDVARKIQNNAEGAVKNFEPKMIYNEFGESNINFLVILKAKKYTEKGNLVHEFIKALKEMYDKEKIDISWPVRKIVR